MDHRWIMEVLKKHTEALSCQMITSPASNLTSTSGRILHVSHLTNRCPPRAMHLMQLPVMLMCQWYWMIREKISIWSDEMSHSNARINLYFGVIQESPELKERIGT